jgi:hypothetical protein
MSPGERQSRVSQTSLLLRELLLSRPGYRQLWQEQAERRRSAAISKAGVARVIALHQRGTAERASGNSPPHRDLKDRVRRALAGESLTPQTLTWFVAAFGMDERDERVLWASYAGDHERSTGISQTIITNRELALPQRHRTIALFERYAIAADRRVATRRTLQTIMAIDDGVDTYPCAHEPAVERVDVIYGGTLGRHYVHGDGLHTAAIVLERELLNGETASLEYRCHYPAGGYHAAEVRRPARGRSENVDIAVQFHESALPRQVSWAVWPDYLDGSPVAEEPVPLDVHGSAHRFVRFIEETVIGFRWEW